MHIANFTLLISFGLATFVGSTYGAATKPKKNVRFSEQSPSAGSPPVSIDNTTQEPDCGSQEGDSCPLEVHLVEKDYDDAPSNASSEPANNSGQGTDSQPSYVGRHRRVRKTPEPYLTSSGRSNVKGLVISGKRDRFDQTDVDRAVSNFPEQDANLDSLFTEESSAFEAPPQVLIRDATLEPHQRVPSYAFSKVEAVIVKEPKAANKRHRRKQYNHRARYAFDDYDYDYDEYEYEDDHGSILEYEEEAGDDQDDNTYFEYERVPVPTRVIEEVEPEEDGDSQSELYSMSQRQRNPNVSVYRRKPSRGNLRRLISQDQVDRPRQRTTRRRISRPGRERPRNANLSRYISQSQVENEEEEYDNYVLYDDEEDEESYEDEQITINAPNSDIHSFVSSDRVNKPRTQISGSEYVELQRASRAVDDRDRTQFITVNVPRGTRRRRSTVPHAATSTFKVVKNPSPIVVEPFEAASQPAAKEPARYNLIPQSDLTVPSPQGTSHRHGKPIRRRRTFVTLASEDDFDETEDTCAPSIVYRRVRRRRTVNPSSMEKEEDSIDEQEEPRSHRRFVRRVRRRQTYPSSSVGEETRNDPQPTQPTQPSTEEVQTGPEPTPSTTGETDAESEFMNSYAPQSILAQPMHLVKPRNATPATVPVRKVYRVRTIGGKGRRESSYPRKLRAPVDEVISAAIDPNQVEDSDEFLGRVYSWRESHY